MLSSAMAQTATRPRSTVKPFSNNLHNPGISILYIDIITIVLAKIPQLSYTHTTTISEVFTRSGPHLFFVCFLLEL